MTRRLRPTTALLAAGLLVGALAACEPEPGPAGPSGPTPAPTSQFSLSWAKPVTNQKNISTASPVVVDNNGSPFVVTGDLGGNLKAFDLATGAPKPGWSNVNAGFEIKAPLSSDGTNVYVPVAQDGRDRVPQFKKFGPTGSLLWNTNAGTTYPSSGGFLLAGMSLTEVNGSWRAYGASSGHRFYGFNGDTGAKNWEFRNAESTMATPALADLYDHGSPQIIFSNDKGSSGSGDKYGGHLRIMTDSGNQVCSASQLADGNTHASSGYNNSSPAVTEIDGDPLIVFGSTGPNQNGNGGNQVVAYDSNCRLSWASPALGGQAKASPTFADVMGTGEPQVIQLVQQLDGAKKYPRVYVLDAGTGEILSDTGPNLRTYGGTNLAYTSATSVATADLNGDGREELFVPSQKLLVLDGRTRTVMQAINLGGSVFQNTPVVTAEPDGGVRVTVAGYSGNNGNGVFGSTIRSYTAPGGTLGANGWPRFGQNSQLTGRLGETSKLYDTVLQSTILSPGDTLRSRTGGYTGTMQPNGNFVIRNSGGSPRWSTGTNVAGSKMKIGVNGDLVILSPTNTVLWQTGKVGPGVERLVLEANGKLRTISATYSGVHRTNTDRALWSS